MTGKNIVITGASKGIGAALAKGYARQGITLGLIARDAQTLEAVAQQCRQQGATVIPGIIDITHTSELREWIKGFDDQHSIDLLIANAGVTSLVGTQGEAESIQAICKVIDTNLYGVIHTVDAVLAAMRRRKRGQLALISSLAAYRGMPVTPAYCASKAAVKSYGEALRGWLGPEGIKVTVICPGFVASDMTEQFSAPKPFMIKPEQAAQLIQRGLKKDKAIVSFPFPMNLGMWLLAILPFPIASFFLGLSGYNRRR